MGHVEGITFIDTWGDGYDSRSEEVCDRLEFDHLVGEVRELAISRSPSDDGESKAVIIISSDLVE